MKFHDQDRHSSPMACPACCHPEQPVSSTSIPGVSVNREDVPPAVILSSLCHPERMSRSPERSEGEGSLCPASQTLRGVYPERSEWAQGDKRRQAAQVGRPGTSVSVNTYGGKPWPLAGAMCPWHENKPMDGILNINKATGMTSHDVVAS